MARVQRQVTGAGLEGADDARQQLQATLGEQCHWLVLGDAMGEQGMAHAVGLAVQLGIIPGAVLATGDLLLAVLIDLCLEQLDERAVQGVGHFGLVVLQDPFAVLATLQLRHLLQGGLQLAGQGYQELLELRQQGVHGRPVEVARVVRQVQTELLAGVHHDGNRVVGVGTR
ncbi:hypothetical protein D3C79_608430 [compost metagenome]